MFAKNVEIKSMLEKMMGVKFEGDLGIADRLWLRKEIRGKIKDLGRRRLERVG